MFTVRINDIIMNVPDLHRKEIIYLHNDMFKINIFFKIPIPYILLKKIISFYSCVPTYEH